MSALINQARNRVPRFAEAAVERARLTVVPRRSTRAARVPFVPEGSEPPLRLLTRGAEKASESEIEQNPRAASVRLRAVERVRGGAA